MEIRRVPNDGKHLEQSGSIISFLTCNGTKKPKYIYVGKSDGGIEIAQPTEGECIQMIGRLNRLFPKET